MIDGGRRTGGRTRRGAWGLIVAVVAAIGLIVAGRFGVLTPIEGFAAIPLDALSGVVYRAGSALNDSVTRFADVQSLQARIADLETALALYQSELVELREVASDYDRLAGLLDYTTRARSQEFRTADVIGKDQTGLLRTITINRGARDGITVGMPVVTQQGLVGRVIVISANAARVMLVTEPTSAINARLQASRAEGSIVGLPSGSLAMEFLPLDATVTEGDLAITSGLGGSFPPDLVLGQVTSVRLAQNGLYQVAQVRSLVDFDTLEFVLVITDFQPVDLGTLGE